MSAARSARDGFLSDRIVAQTFAVVFLAPLSVFVLALLLLDWQRPVRPLEVVVDTPPHCGPPPIIQVEQCVPGSLYPRTWARRTLHCEPAGILDRHWSIPVRLQKSVAGPRPSTDRASTVRGAGSDEPFPRDSRQFPREFRQSAGEGRRECSFELRAYDGATGQPTPEEADYAGLFRAPGHDQWEFSGKPWRTYALLVVWRDGAATGFASKPVILSFHRTRGINLRLSALLQFIGLASAAVAFVLLLLRFRPHGPNSLRWMESSRTLAVGVLSGAGGMATAMLISLLPPGLGGRNEEIPPESMLSLMLIAGVACALAGIAFDRLRSRVAMSGRFAPQLASIVPGAVLSAFLVPVLLGIYAGTTGDTLLGIGTSYKSIHYLYLALALIVPMLVYEEPTWQRFVTGGGGALKPTPVRFGKRLLWSFLGGIVASVISLFIGDVLAGPIPGQPFLGFYKPASVIGSLVVALPAVAAFSLSLSLGEERPEWLQLLERRLWSLEAQRDGARRARQSRVVLALAIGHSAELQRIPGALRFSAHLLLSLIRSQEREDREQLALQLGRPVHDIDASFDQLAAWLAKRPSLAVEERTSLLLATDDGGLRVGELVALAEPSPERDLLLGPSVTRDGVPVRSGGQLHAGVSGMVDAVELLVGRLGDGPLPFAGRRVRIDFRFGPEESGFRGRSYELPLALALVPLAIGTSPRVSSWLASGSVDPAFGDIDGADCLDVKCRALHPRSLLISGAAAVEAQRTAFPEDVVPVVLPEPGEPGESASLERVRRRVADGDRVVVGAHSLRQAISLVYGVRGGAS